MGKQSFLLAEIASRSAPAAQRGRGWIWLLLGAATLPAAAQPLNSPVLPNTMTEGQTVTGSVVLSSAPSQDLTVEVSSNDPALSATPTTLTFTPTSWAPQTVTIRAVEDDDGDWEEVVVRIGEKQYSVRVVDNDPKQVKLGPRRIHIKEGQTRQYTVVLSTNPSGTVTVTPSVLRGASDAFEVSGALTFTSANWSKPQPVTVTALEDLDGQNEETVISHDVQGYDVGGYPGLPVDAGSVKVTVQDNDFERLRVPTRSITIVEGGQAQDEQSFDVSLDARPDEAITVTLASSSPSLSVNPSTLTFQPDAWNMAQTVTLAAPKDDDIDGWLATVSYTATGGFWGPSPLEVLVRDLDQPHATMEPVPVSVGEGGELTAAIKLDFRPLLGPATVRVNSSDTSAVAVSPRTLTFTSSDWSMAQAVTLIGVEDQNEDDETVYLQYGVTYQGIWGTRKFSRTVTVSVSDNDKTTTPRNSLMLSADRAATEGGPDVTVTATLTNPAPAGGTEVTLTVGADSSASLGEDYTLSRTVFTIREGERAGTVRVGIIDDTVDEDSETIYLQAQTTNPVLSADLGLVIADNDVNNELLTLNRPTVRLSASPNPVAEGSPVTVTARLSAALDSDVTVPLRLSPGTAEEGDYGTLASIAIHAGQTTGRGTITTAEDADSDDETFTVALGSLPSALRPGSPRSVTVTISDDGGRGGGSGRSTRPAVRLYAFPNPVMEGSAVTVTALLSRALGRTVTVPLRVMSDTAEEGDHGTLANIVIEAGRTSGTGEITTAADTDTDDETFTVALGSLPSALRPGSPRSVTVTISDDGGGGGGIWTRPAVRLSISPNPVTEGSPVTVTAQLSAALDRDVSVPLALAPGTAEAGDYGTLASIAIRAGRTAGRGEITTAKDMDGDDETFTVALGSLPSALRAGSPRSVAVTILDHGSPDVGISFSTSSRTVPEGKSATVDLVLTRPPGRTVDLSLLVTAEPDALPEEYVVPDTVRFYPEESRKVIEFKSVHDEIAENDETVTLRLGSLPLGFVAGDRPEVSITVLDDDLPLVAISGVTSSVVEGRDAQFRLSRAGDPSVALAVPVRVTEIGEFLRGRVPSAVTFAAGAGEVLLALPTLDDSLDEPDGEISVTLAESPRYAVSGPATAIVTVADNDSKPELVVTGASVPESAGWIEFPVLLRGANADGVTVQWSTADLTATTGVDYEGTGGTLTLSPGETSGSVRIRVINDVLPEDDETFTLTLFGPANALLGTLSATGTITDDDEGVTVAWLSRFGRTVASQVVDGVTDRLEGNFDGGGLASALSRPAASDVHGYLLGLRDLLGRRSFQYSTKSEAGETQPAGGDWTLWGRGVRTGFGGTDGDLSVDGSVLTGLAGVDYERGRVLAGVAVSRSFGEGRAGARSGSSAAGAVESALSGAFPYLRIRMGERISAWALGGHGRGTMSFAGEGGERHGIQMNMGAVGARGDLLSPAGGTGFGVALKSDALVLRMNSETGGSRLPALADASRARLLLEASSRARAGAGSTVGAVVELGVRLDGGDAETGTGVEVGGGLEYVNTPAGLRVEASLRALVAHQDADFSEWGLGGSIAYQPGGPRQGLSLRMGTFYGASNSAIHDLWSSPHAARDLAVRARRDALGRELGTRMSAEARYGLALLGDRMAMAPFADIRQDWATGAGALRVGWRFSLMNSLSLSLEAELAQGSTGRAGRGLALRRSLRYW